jgi:hypothetical protein
MRTQKLFGWRTDVQEVSHEIKSALHKSKSVIQRESGN